MEITAIASSSTANCCALEHNGSRLILEAGVPFKNLSKALGGEASSAVGCLITHEHGDHAKYVESYIKNGIDCYMSNGTANALNIPDKAKVPLKKTWFKIGGWHIYMFPSKHDAAEPVGYIVQKNENRIMFLTDTRIIPSIIDGLTHLIIECNYCDDIIQKSTAYHANRAYVEHLGLEQVKDYLSEIDLSQLQEVVLIHLSSEHSDEKRMISEIQEIVGSAVCVWAAGE